VKTFIRKTSQVQRHGRFAQRKRIIRCARLAKQKVRRNDRQDLLTAANLDFGRFSRGSVGDADKIGLIAGKNDAGKRKRSH
jgi:hypothetical protein